MARILILGGGFGGIAAATALGRRLRPEHEVVVVDRRDAFLMGLRKLWALVGIDTLQAGTRARDRLTRHGLRFLKTGILRIDPETRRVETEAGPLDADYLIVALGAETRPDLVPGLKEHGHDLYDAAAIPPLAARVAAFSGGRVVVAIAGLPYKCPPAPYEATLLLEESFRRRGIRDRVELTFTTLQPSLLPAAGPEGHRRMAEEFSRRGVTWHVGRKVTRFEAAQVVYEDGSVPCDLAIGVPPHRPPRVVAESALAGEGGWISVDRHTLATRVPRVFAVGDVTHIPLGGAAALPKAGVFAEAEGERVAAAIAAEILGEPEPARFDGRGYCFLEMGSREATLVEGEFYADGGPRVVLRENSEKYAQEKRRFESERLARWFGE